MQPPLQPTRVERDGRRAAARQHVLLRVSAEPPRLLSDSECAFAAARILTGVWRWLPWGAWSCCESPRARLV